MHDGQNLFDDKTSFVGEWKVDESLNQLATAGDWGCIVVGIESDGNRLNELSPWVNPQYGGGEGAAYIEFIVNTLKPFVDAHFRTQAGRLGTAIGGSSMGGLISEYGMMERQDVFSKALVFSPAFWFAGTSSVNHVLAKGKTGDTRTYFLAGGQEPAYVSTDMGAVANAMLSTGVPASEISLNTVGDGQHSEWFWAREFPAGYQWLFKNSTATGEISEASGWEIYPNPAGDLLRVAGLGEFQRLDFQILGIDGRVWRDSSATLAEPIKVGNLPPGMYFLKLKFEGKELGVRPFAIAK